MGIDSLLAYTLLHVFAFHSLISVWYFYKSSSTLAHFGEKASDRKGWGVTEGRGGGVPIVWWMVGGVLLQPPMAPAEMK